jgi:hypothetical protein
MSAGCGDDGAGGSIDAGDGDPGTDASVPPSVGPDLPIPDPIIVFYVSSSLGDDSWSGSMPEPNMASTDGPKATLDGARSLLNGAAPGTHVLLRRGDTWNVTSTTEIGAATGTDADPILLGAYGMGSQPSIVATGDNTTIVVRGNSGGTSQYFRIDDIRLTSTTPSDSQVAIYTGESFHPEVPHHLTFSKLTIEDNGAGMTLYGNDHLVHGSRIANNNEGMGIYASGDSLSFQYNEFENNGLPPPDVFVHSLYLSNCNGLLFEHNVVHSATDGVKVRRTSNAVIRYNTFHDMEALGIHLGGDSEGGANNNRIESNVFYNNSSGIVIKSESGVQVVPLDGLVIANNILYAGTEGFVDYGTHITLTDVPAQNVSIVNNLVYAADGDNGIRIDNDGADIVCANNIVGQFTGGDAYSLNGSVSESNNLDYASAQAFAALELSDPAEHDFTPTAGSTALIDQGMDVSDVISTDHDGEPRPQGSGFDIGPYEYAP